MSKQEPVKCVCLLVEYGPQTVTLSAPDWNVRLSIPHGGLTVSRVLEVARDLPRMVKPKLRGYTILYIRYHRDAIELMYASKRAIADGVPMPIPNEWRIHD